MPHKHKKHVKHAKIFTEAKQSFPKTQPKVEDAITRKPTMSNLLKFALPTILSMIIMSTMGIVDGVFVSRWIDQNALAAVSLVFPFFGFVMAIGFMLGVGGNAMIAKKIGEGKEVEGRQNFSLIIITGIIVAAAISMIGVLAPDFILNILGVDYGVARQMAIDYMMPLVYFAPVIVSGMMFQQFLITAGKAHYSAITSFASGIVSIGLNFLFIYHLDMGLQGAALATSIGYSLSALVGWVFFSINRKGNLYFVMPKFDIRALGRASINGASEMVTMLATSIVVVLMNNILMDIEGGGLEAVAAASIMFAGMGVFSALFIGYSSGVAPITSYNFGKGDTDNLKLSYKNNMIIIGVLSIVATGLAFLLIDPLMLVYDIEPYVHMFDFIPTPDMYGIYVENSVYHLARRGFFFITASFILMAYNSFGTMFFTALNNGVVSSLLSLFRTLIFPVLAFWILPTIWGLDGAWAAMPAAEILGIVLTVVFFIKMKKRYNYA
ncbi:MAG: MATE family efflux transporter [Defluviitaleaceae bacterium]|nr:MATE family efflux transporter [Defluviitaleaceae bacterium]